MTEDEKQQKYIEIWSKTVDTQMHFNEMQVKSRQLGLTFVTATLGVAVVLLSKGDDFSLSFSILKININIHVSVILTLVALFALRAVKELDLNVYHRMLRGAVTFGEDFEENYLKQVFDLNKGMTQSISHFSRFDDASKVKIPDSNSYVYTGKEEVTAHDKIKKFYTNTSRALWLTAIALLLVTNWSTVSALISKLCS